MSPATPGQAQSAKIVTDLQGVLSASTTPTINWARDVHATRFVKVLIVSHSDDAELGALRTAVMSAGASIYCRHCSKLALAGLLPAHQLSTIAARPEVQSISLNRRMTRATSTVDTVTAAVRSTGSTTFPRRLGLTGAGIGIAVLDSGISYQHNPFKGDGGESRVREAVSFTKAGDAVRAGVRDWTAGIDVSGTLNPSSPTLQTGLGKIPNGFDAKEDRYGHGSNVAAVAAGRGAYPSVDTTGIAPNAKLWDLRVLDDNGYGQLADVLAGIDWGIYCTGYKNTRVMNLSLGTDSTESSQADPLARVVRSAVVQGIVVVVAAGKEGYGTISSPGHEPSAITVGAINLKGTASRSDNLLKPDRVAPGNRIVSALWADTQAVGGAWNVLATKYPDPAKVGLTPPLAEPSIDDQRPERALGHAGVRRRQRRAHGRGPVQAMTAVLRPAPAVGA